MARGLPGGKRTFNKTLVFGGSPANGKEVFFAFEGRVAY